MQEPLVKLFAKELTKISDIEESSIREVSYQALPFHTQAWCIVIHLSGYIQGFLAVTIEPQLAYEISHAILQKSLGSFAKKDIDERLCQNTIGEIGNMALGEFFRTKKHEKSTYIAAPLYSELPREKNLLQQAGGHFQLDTLGRAYYLSGLMKRPRSLGL